MYSLYNGFKPFLENYPLSTDNPWFWLWIIASIVSSVYAYTWDIKMDWGLLDAKSGDSRFLREEIVYSSTVRRNLNKLPPMNKD